MLSNCSLLLVCLLGCSVVQGYTHEWREKAQLRGTRDANLFFLFFWVDLFDDISVDIVNVVPSCGRALESYRNNLLASDTGNEEKLDTLSSKTNEFYYALDDYTEQHEDPKPLQRLCSSL